MGLTAWLTVLRTVSSNIFDFRVHDGCHVAERAENDKSGVPVGARVEYSDHQRVSTCIKYATIHM